MLAVTTQSKVKERLCHVASTLGFPQPTFCSRVADLAAHDVHDATLLVDLGSCCREPRLQIGLLSWLARHPGSLLILFVPLIDRDCEMHAMFDLAPIAATQVMTASDFARTEVWHNVLARSTLATFQAQIRADFLRAVHALRRPLPAQSIVLRLLILAPTIADVHATAAVAIGQPTSKSAACRRIVWRELRRLGQMTATRLLLLFRALWYRRLADAGWPPRTIAIFLGFPTPRHLRLTFRRRLGVPMRQLQRVSYGELLDFVARACVDGQVRHGRLSLERDDKMPLGEGRVNSSASPANGP